MAVTFQPSVSEGKHRKRQEVKQLLKDWVMPYTLRDGLFLLGRNTVTFPPCSD